MSSESLSMAISLGGHRILTRPPYVGRHQLNKRAKNNTLKPAAEIVTVDVSRLIDQATFEAVQAHLRARNPKVTPARVVSVAVSGMESGLLSRVAVYGGQRGSVGLPRPASLIEINVVARPLRHFASATERNSGRAVGFQ